MPYAISTRKPTQASQPPMCRTRSQTQLPPFALLPQLSLPQGRGFSLPSDIQLVDCRAVGLGEPAVLYPMREVRGLGRGCNGVWRARHMSVQGTAMPSAGPM